MRHQGPSPIEYIRAIRDLESQIRGLTQALHLAQTINVSLLHKLGGQITFAAGQMKALERDFPFISIDTEPGFISLKLKTELPEVPR